MDRTISNYEGDEVDHEDGDGDGAALDDGVDGDSEGGTAEPSGGDSGGVSPLRSSPVATFCLSVSGFMFQRRLPTKILGGSLYRSF